MFGFGVQAQLKNKKSRCSRVQTDFPRYRWSDDANLESEWRGGFKVVCTSSPEYNKLHAQKDENQNAPKSMVRVDFGDMRMITSTPGPTPDKDL